MLLMSSPYLGATISEREGLLPFLGVAIGVKMGDSGYECSVCSLLEVPTSGSVANVSSVSCVALSGVWRRPLSIRTLAPSISPIF